MKRDMDSRHSGSMLQDVCVTFVVSPVMTLPEIVSDRRTDIPRTAKLQLTQSGKNDASD